MIFFVIIGLKSHLYTSFRYFLSQKMGYSTKFRFSFVFFFLNCCLGTACGCRFLDATFVCHYRGVTFICMRVIYTSNIYFINDKKSNQ